MTFRPLNNPGNAPLLIEGAVLSDLADFSLSASTCGTSLDAGASCSYFIALSPQAVGPLFTTLTITDNAGGVHGSQQKVSLSGTGLPVPVAQLTASASALAFPATVEKATATTQVLTLSNSGNAPLTIVGAELSDSTDYCLANTCAGTIAPGASCALAASFSPQGTGSLSAVLTLTDNSGLPAGTVQQRIAITGLGLPISVPQASLAPTAGSFGNVSANATSTPQTSAER